MLTINYKIKSKLVEEFLKQDDINELEKTSIFSKIAFKKKQFADIYFHTGSLDKEAIKNITEAKKVIVNSITSKGQLSKETDISKDKIEVIYPAVDVNYRKSKDMKKELCEELEIDSKKKIVFFTAQNIKANGVIEFINIIMQLNFRDMIAVIAADKKQIYNLKFQLSKFNVDDKLILLEDYEDIDKLFLASDVFLLPTHNRNFASNILRAMYCKCVVFTTVYNSSKELIDVFSTMETSQDRSIVFKIDALLQNKADMKLIKNQNRKIAKQYTLDKQLSKLDEIITNL